MKTLLITGILFLLAGGSMAQTDTTRPDQPIVQSKADTTHRPAADSSGRVPNDTSRKVFNDTSLLKGITVTARPNPVSTIAGGLSYNVDADPDSRNRNILELMEKMPFMSTDASGALLFKGNSSYRILINGRVNSLMERNPQQILRSIPASTIVRVEIITTPSSKYEAEGIAGVINIITNRRMDNGFKGNLSAGHRWPVGGPNLGGSVNIRRGKLGVSSYGGWNRNVTPETNADFARESLNGQQLQQGSAQSDAGNSGYAGIELNYDLDSLNLLTLNGGLNRGRTRSLNSQRSLLNDPFQVLERYALAGISIGRSRGYDAGLNYQRGFRDSKTRLLTFSMNRYEYRGDQDGSFDVSDQMNYPLNDYRQSNRSSAREQAAQVDYVQQMGKVKMETGIKAIFRRNLSDAVYSELNDSSGKFEDDPTRSDDLHNDQNIYSIYNSHSWSKGKWSVNGGLRLERTTTDAEFSTGSSRVKQDYLNLLPSFSSNFAVAKQQSLSIGFTQRVRRPSLQRLNPFVDRSNPNYEVSGNPALRPGIINEIPVGYNLNGKLSLNAGIHFSWVNNIDFQVVTLDEATGISRLTYANIGKGRALGMDVNVRYPLFKGFDLRFNSNLARISLRTQVNGGDENNDFVVFFLSPSANYKFGKTWNGSASLNVISRRPNNLQGTSNGFVGTNFSLTRDLLKNKLSLAGGIQNPFGKFRYQETRTSGVNFNEDRRSQQYFRAFRLTATWNFGKLERSVRKAERGIRNDDGGGAK